MGNVNKMPIHRTSTTLLAALAALAIAPDVAAQGDSEDLYSARSGGYEIDVVRSKGRACQLTMFTGARKDQGFALVYDRFSAPALVMVTPTFPADGAVPAGDRLTLQFTTRGKERTLALDMSVQKNTSPAGETLYLLRRNAFTRDDAAALVAAPRFAVLNSRGDVVLAMDPPTFSKNPAVRAYEECKTTIGEKPRP